MKQTRIILAEDNKQHQKLLRHALESGNDGMEIVVVSNGAEFLQAVRGQKFDCAIMDFRLPDMTADRLLRRAAAYLGDTPSLIISSSKEQAVVIASLRSGGADFIPKEEAVRGTELRSRVEAVLAAVRRKSQGLRRTERRVRHLAHLAETDPLTNLSNRRHLQRLLSQGRWRRDRRRGLACLMLDLDHFKTINDVHGHTVGDAVLQRIPALIAPLVNPSDMIVRWGGEEFLIVASCESAVEAWVIGEQVRQSIETGSVSAGGKEINITASIGLVYSPCHDFSEFTISLADRALYLAKDTGRNRICTDTMVYFDRILDQVQDLTDAGPEERRHEFLSRAWHMLGPTQQHCMTDHCEKVGMVATEVGRKLGLPEEELRRLRLAGLFHALGKVYTPEEVLGKPQKLSANERRLITPHPHYGAAIARRLGLDELTARYISLHHTPFTRCQYKSVSSTVAKIAGDSGDSAGLPLGGRILCLADAVATMRVDRPYSTALSPAEAAAELMFQRGQQFDPDVVDAAMKLWTTIDRLAA